MANFRLIINIASILRVSFITSVSSDWLIEVTSTNARFSLSFLSCSLASASLKFCFIFNNSRLRIVLLSVWIANSLCFSELSESSEVLEDEPEYLEPFEDLDLHNWSKADQQLLSCYFGFRIIIELTYKPFTSYSDPIYPFIIFIKKLLRLRYFCAGCM